MTGESSPILPTSRGLAGRREGGLSSILTSPSSLLLVLTCVVLALLLRNARVEVAELSGQLDRAQRHVQALTQTGFQKDSEVSQLTTKAQLIEADRAEVQGKLDAATAALDKGKADAAAAARELETVRWARLVLRRAQLRKACRAELPPSSVNLVPSTQVKTERDSAIHGRNEEAALRSRAETDAAGEIACVWWVGGGGGIVLSGMSSLGDMPRSLTPKTCVQG